jgi:cytochrome P450
LSRNPTVYARLAEEIRTTFEAGQDIGTGAKLSSCKYLRAVIDETLRIAPPLPSTLWRQISPKAGDLIVEGQVIPSGTLVGINPFAMMRNEKYFDSPLEFRPERWLAEDAAASDARKAFAPFALGDTSCLGKTLAYNETSVTLAKTLFYFDFEKAPGEAGKLGQGVAGDVKGRHREDEYQLYETLTADHEGPCLVFTARNVDRAELYEA